jgi:multiple sugar transport system permease protein
MVRSKGRSVDYAMTLTKYLIGIVAISFFFFPIFWLLKASFNKPIDAVTLPPVWVFKPILENYLAIFREEPFARFLRNSLFVSGGATFAALIIGLPAAYAFARFEFKRKTDLAFWILSIFMFPPLASILPYLILFQKFRLVDTIPGLLLAHLSFILPLSVWLLQRFIRDIPVEVEECALVDGDFIFALVLAPVSAKTLPVASVSLSSWAYINWGKISAASIIIMGPVLILILLSRRYLVRGFTFGLK